MILSLACLLLSLATGAALVWKYAGVRAMSPRWAAVLVTAGAGGAVGVGLGSSLYLLFAAAMPAAWAISLVVEAAVLVWCVYALAREPKEIPAPSESGWDVWTMAAAGALALAVVIATFAMNEAWTNNPQGNWDAWSIWNLRAKFLAVPDVAARAWSIQLGETHPEYPLLLPGAIARCWRAGSNILPAIPMAIGYAMFLALVSAVTGAVAILRGGLSGLVAGVVIATTPALLAEVPAQYADVPLAAYFACAVTLMLLDRPLWAGLLAGLAAWTKDEGLFFCFVLLAATALFRRSDVVWLVLGLLPASLMTGVFKVLVAPQITGVIGGGIGSKLGDGNRYAVLARGLARDLVALGTGWYHPALPLAAYSAATGVGRGPSRDAWFATSMAVGTLAGYCAIVIAAQAEIQWQVDTALRRLLVQWWPLVVIAVAMWQKRAPAAAALAAPESRQQRRDKKRRER